MRICFNCVSRLQSRSRLPFNPTRNPKHPNRPRHCVRSGGGDFAATLAAPTPLSRWSFLSKRDDRLSRAVPCGGTNLLVHARERPGQRPLRHGTGSVSEFGNTRAYARVSLRSRGRLVAKCSRPVRFLQSMLMPVQIATRAIAPHAVNLSIANGTNWAP